MKNGRKTILATDQQRKAAELVLIHDVLMKHVAVRFSVSVWTIHALVRNAKAQLESR